MANEKFPIAASSCTGLCERPDKRADEGEGIDHAILDDNGVWTRTRKSNGLVEEVGTCSQRDVVHEEPVQSQAIGRMHCDVVV